MHDRNYKYKQKRIQSQDVNQDKPYQVLPERWAARSPKNQCPSACQTITNCLPKHCLLHPQKKRHQNIAGYRDICSGPGTVVEIPKKFEQPGRKESERKRENLHLSGCSLRLVHKASEQGLRIATACTRKPTQLASCHQKEAITVCMCSSSCE